MAIVAGAAFAFVMASVITPVQAQVNTAAQFVIILNFDGTVLRGSGFTVSLPSAGRYLLSFPPRTFKPPSEPGDFSAYPVVNVTPLGSGDIIANVSNLIVDLDGSGRLFIDTKDTNGNVVYPFMFITITK
ncbi:MAG: hypothetical protein AB7L70_16740 [Pyrinomonadaceae bacterium]